MPSDNEETHLHIYIFFALIGNIMMIHLSLTGPKTPLKQTSEMWGKQLHRA